MIHRLAVVETTRLGSGVRVAEFAVVRLGARLDDDVVIHPHVVIEGGAHIRSGTEIFPGCHIGKRPYGAGVTSRPIRPEASVDIGAGCALGPHAVVYGGVTLGAGCLVGDGASIREESTIGDRCIIGRHVTVNYSTTIGSEVKIMDHCWLAGNMRIGDRVFLSGGVLTANDNRMGSEGYVEAEVVGPVIEDDARVGVGAILLPGLRIGRGAVVAAGAVVTRDVAPFTSVRGIPARTSSRATTQPPVEPEEGER